MYMGVILEEAGNKASLRGAPHVYGGDPTG